MTAALLVAVFGGLGAALRFVVDGEVRRRWTGAFPLATVVVNVTGSLLIGLLVGAQLHLGLGPPWFTAVTTGLCGGYTTFSTASVETVRLVQAGEVRAAWANALGSLVLCVAATAAGIALVTLAAR
ncbi:fluoride efflux transporter FluC [Cellulomonas oligotrophica]|uniref:Fluoride-specific ion channel FluC n=1 Tax=Cellulomonas oligotrophica TaxID=931536 RepID=A0A7Y9FGD2_9CELL|nr:CrcB family protein [Cellulomonas oligotrophica]NYD86532.1 CrcB protein [Cellulomonas oligotrophica]GIG32578.1 putative fluoride ion transporter CrcB [Cellulomonas oligotrophica]